MFNLIKSAIPALVGASVMLAAASLYDIVIDDPSVRADARAIAMAEARARTEAAIGEVQDHAEKARALRRYCIDVGGVWEFAAARCRDR